jgi:hypothetical protein
MDEEKLYRGGAGPSAWTSREVQGEDLTERIHNDDIVQTQMNFKYITSHDGSFECRRHIICFLPLECAKLTEVSSWIIGLVTEGSGSLGLVSINLAPCSLYHSLRYVALKFSIRLGLPGVRKNH